MITIRSNINLVTTRLINQLSALQDPRPLLREVAVDVLAKMVPRIHEEGKAADGSQIGTYSKGYMVVRTGAYKNASRVSRGKNLGKVKNAGTYTKGRDFKNGQEFGMVLQRPRYNRTADTKVIVSLTRQLENDWSVIGTAKGWGIGFNNPFNLKKMKWVEARKKKAIASLTSQERAFAIERFQELVQEEFNKA